MKKKLLIISILILAILIFAISKYEPTIKGDEGLIAKVREELALPDDSTADITIAGSSYSNDRYMFWFVVSDEEQQNTYVPMTFTEVSQGEYNYERKYRSVKEAKDIFYEHFDMGVSIFINNPSCAYIKTVTPIETEYIPVDNIPFVYYFVTQEGFSSFDFLDADKNVIK